MAENVVPGGGANADVSRGMPYYEKLRRDLRETLQKKRLLEKNLASIEDQIYKVENSYLEETSAGNIVKGFDNYIKGSSGAGGGGGGAGAGGRKRAVVNDGDRVFSRSSASFLRDSPGPTPPSTQTTPSHAPTPSSARESAQPTPTATTSTAAVKNPKKSKKAAAADNDGADEEVGRKRLKVNFSGRDA
ncbi:MAG: hypothetical protein M1817_004969 [Caeruleum heppii]|nr:MAG: hypothetical protein M1817_004969 [Caeruleum heppii]